jgi:hypothetical protein
MVDHAESMVVIINVILGLAFGLPLARRLVLHKHIPWSTASSYMALVTVYFIESVGFMAGMTTSIPGIVLAFVWGLLLGRWARRSETQIKAVLKSAVFLSVYTSLPAVSLLSVPVLMRFAGWPVFSAEAGARFGVPEFIPSPWNTIFGFCALVAMFAVSLKTIITSGVTYAVSRSTILKWRVNGTP